MKSTQGRRARLGVFLALGAMVLAGIPKPGAVALGGFLAIAAVVLGCVRLLRSLIGSAPRQGTGTAATSVVLGMLALMLVFFGVMREARVFHSNRSAWRDPSLERMRVARGGEEFGGPVRTRPALTNYPSRLPIVVISTSGRFVEKDSGTFVRAEVYEPGRSAGFQPTNAQYSGFATIHFRGHSSLRLPKLSYTVHLVDAATNQVKAALLGMPKDDDWVLYAPFEDKTMIRDMLAYEMAAKMGYYAPRTRFVELFVNRTTGPASTLDYEGVYVLVEKIKRGEQRVNIAKLEADDQSEPDISGGYILKRDHHDRDGIRFHTSQGGPYFHVYPGDRAITREQRTWIARYFEAFETALFSPNFADPDTGYAAFLDVDAFIDAHWLVEATKNVDGFRYSTFLTKDRGGKIRMGPPWDWNRAFGNANYYDGWETEGWYWQNLRSSEISWHVRLRDDPRYVARASARWRELRRTAMDPEFLSRRIDQLAAELDGAQQRNFQRWPIMGRRVTCNYFVGDTYAEEIEWLKDWIRRRVAWIDSQVGGRPPRERPAKPQTE